MLIRETNYGKVEGFEKDDILCWFGIPFAKPPVGELRFKRARKPEAWDGVRPCFEKGNAPCEFTAGALAESGGPTMTPSEDCLYMNIWAPKEEGKHPVFVWIYGGANHQGDSARPDFNMDSFAENGVVGVNFNYRLGPLGFYDFSPYSEEFESNCAPSDQIAALTWVHENIEKFGGDPDNITICGESAGGMSVYAMLTTEKTKGLFRKAIAMSGLSDNIDCPKSHALNIKLYLDELGVDVSEIEKLKTMSVEELKAPIHVIMESNDAYPGILLPGPTIDGDMFKCKPWEALEKGNAKDVKCIFGTCKDEGTLFYPMRMECMDWDQVKTMMVNSGMEDKLGQLEAVYKDGGVPALIALNGDRMFWRDMVRCANAQSKHNTVYSFRVDFETEMAKEMKLFAHHGSDVPLIFNTWEGGMNDFNPGTPHEKLETMRKHVHGMAVNFCKTGAPGECGGVAWEEYNADTRKTMMLNLECHMEEKPREEYFKAWDGIELYAK